MIFAILLIFILCKHCIAQVHAIPTRRENSLQYMFFSGFIMLCVYFKVTPLLFVWLLQSAQCLQKVLVPTFEQTNGGLK